MAPTGADAGQGPVPSEGAGTAAGGERSGERRGRRRGRRGRRGGGPREARRAGGRPRSRRTTPRVPPEDYPGDDAEPNEPGEGTAPGGERPRRQWRGLRHGRTAAQRAARWRVDQLDRHGRRRGGARGRSPRPGDRGTGQSRRSTLEPSAIDTAKLPKLESPTEDAPAAAAVRWTEQPHRGSRSPTPSARASAPPAEPTAHDRPVDAARRRRRRTTRAPALHRRLAWSGPRARRRKCRGSGPGRLTGLA